MKSLGKTQIGIVRTVLMLVCALSLHAAPPGEGGGESQGASAGWLSAIDHRIADTEYAITWQNETAIAGLDAAWQSPNRAHDLRTYFTANGIRVISRTEAQPSWEWSMSLVGYGRTPAVSTVEPAAVSAVEPAIPRVRANRIEYDRGRIVEEYVNDQRGLAQRFTLVAPPLTRTGEAGAIRLEQVLGGTLAPVISDDGQAIDLTTPNGRRLLHFGRIVVKDARAKVLSARVEGFNHDGQPGLRIVFDDRDAVYPVGVDALISSAAWTAECNQVNARLGISVATAGDVNGDGYSDVIVGAHLYDNGQADEGRAYVYLGSAAGLETDASWTAESDSVRAEFGAAVATVGDVNGDGYSDVIVGASKYSGDQPEEGRAFVYHGSPAGLETTPSWFAAIGQAGAELGNAVASAGDVNGDGYADVVIGAHLFDDAQEDEGAVFVYHGSPTGLESEISWLAVGGQPGAGFGSAVALAGDVDSDGYSDVIVGATKFDTDKIDQGRVFVFHGSDTGLQSEPSWKFDSGQENAQLGNAVGTAGDVNGDGYADVIVGCSNFGLGQAEEGRVIVFLGSATGLSTDAAWQTESNQHFAHYGHSVATAGDINGDGYADVIVGAVFYDNDSDDEGRAFVYYGSAAGLPRAVAWTSESNQVAAFFGTAVATAGDVNGDGYADIIVGAPRYDIVAPDEGSAFVYHGGPAGLQHAASWTAEVNQTGGALGVTVASAGDVNGDGYSDVIVGANLYDAGFVNEGRAFLYLGAVRGLSATPSWTGEGKQAQALFGGSVASAGDVNGDGYGDVIVGASQYDDGSTDEGRVLVYHGSPFGLHTAAAWAAEGNQADALFGSVVAGAGDVNGDGYADVIVGAWAYDNAQTNEGRAFVYHGSKTGLQTEAAWTAEGNQDGANFAWSVAGAGDVNGDGYSDVIIGASSYDGSQRDEGRAFVYHGTPFGLQTREAWSAGSNQSNSSFGSSVASAGDINRDGYSDVIIGAYQYNNGQVEQGRALTYHGSPNGLSLTRAWAGETGQPGAWFGRAVASAGDVNGDGFSDVIVGAPSLDSGQVDEGRAFVYHGTPGGLQLAVSWIAESNQTGALFASSVASAGDVNGDGYSDVIVGAPKFDNGQSDEGRVLIYYGNDGLGTGLRPQQRRVTDTDFAPIIAPLGASDSAEGFRVAVLARSPFGRGRAKLEWEVKRFGDTLDGSEVQTTEEVDTEDGDESVSGMASALIDATLYHWRARLHYSPATTPFQQRSRWLRANAASAEEAMVRTRALGVGRAPDGTAGAPLRLAKATSSQIGLQWGPSCVRSDTDYGIYEGTLGSFPSHVSRVCSTNGETSTVLTPSGGSSYYLVVPRNTGREGSYGTDSAGIERPAGQTACLPQEILTCQ